MKPCRICRLEISEAWCKYCGTDNTVEAVHVSLKPEDANLEHLLAVEAQKKRGRPRKGA